MQIVILIFISLLIISSPLKADPFWVFFERGQGWEPGDYVPTEMIKGLSGTGMRVRTVSRYFNAVSVNFDGDPHLLERCIGVMYVTPVRRFTIVPFFEVAKSVRQGVSDGNSGEHLLNYGISYNQLQALKIPSLHDSGLIGAGVVIGVLDTGFNIEKTGCLRNIKITHKRNFITGSDNVRGDSHGGQVLACLGGVSDGEYYGAAFGAEFLLALTDDIYTETKADEDRWVAAVEWCDSLGADIISSSVLYNFGFDNPEDDYAKEDMNGCTSLVARAAEIAVSRGIVVVNSAGNEGGNSWRIIATPADAEHVIAVGAVTNPVEGNPTVAWFSSRGPTADGRIKPDVMAPGVGVIIPVLGASGSYLTYNGTSFSAPLITGLCALLLEAYPDWTPSDIIAALKTSARDLGDEGPDNDYGWGIPDGVLALEYTKVNVDWDNSGKDKLPGQGRLNHDVRTFMLNNPFPNPANAFINISLT
ncbi:S8 family serine peptidase, partial [Candidatus Latescibacterota bacterium]